MTYKTAKEIALCCESYTDVDEFMKLIEEDENISARQFYNLRTLAINSAYNAITAMFS